MNETMSSAVAWDKQDLTISQTVPHVQKSKIRTRKRTGYQAVKRLGDVVCSAAALVALSPLFIGTAIAIKAEDGGSVLYTAERIGKDGKPFQMYKFRSMVQNADQMKQNLTQENERDGPVFKIGNDPRITKVGQVIRKTCIDELPQLVNILKGDMSIVGPRPPLRREVEQYNANQKRRLDITPGLTCYWQIGDHDVSFDEWVALDMKYIEERSLHVDAKLIWKTIGVVLHHKGDT